MFDIGFFVLSRCFISKASKHFICMMMVVVMIVTTTCTMFIMLMVMMVMMAFFMFIPFLGEAIGVVLGLMRANAWITSFSMLLGKSFRYIAIATTALGLTTLFT